MSPLSARWQGIGSPQIATPKPVVRIVFPWDTHLNATDKPLPEGYSRDKVAVLPKAVEEVFFQGEAVRDAYEPWEVEPDAEAPPSEWGREAREDRTAYNFWALVERGEPNACWGWKGARNRQPYRTPVYCVFGRTHNAARWGWGLIHGVLPAGRDVRHSCNNGSCMNPRHWCVSEVVRATGCTAAHQFTSFDRERFLGLHRCNAFPMRALAASFGITEQVAWGLVGLTPSVIAQMTLTASWDAARLAAVKDEAARKGFVRDKEQVIEREKQAIEAAEREAARAVQRAVREAEKKADRERKAIEAAELAAEAEKRRRAAEVAAAAERAVHEAIAAANRKIKEAEEEDFKKLQAFEAREPLLFCPTCIKDVPVRSAIASTMTVLPRGHIGFVARMDQACGFCLTHIRSLDYEFTSILVAKHRKHLVDHAATIDHAVRPVVATLGNRWRHGIKASSVVTCRLCGFTHAWDVERWVAVNNRSKEPST